MGERRQTSAARLWAKIPHAYRQHATCYTDQSGVFAKGMPAAQQQAISTFARTINPIERCNNTRRPRMSRLVRDALAFAQKLAYHSGASTRFFYHDNLARVAA